MKSLSMIVVSLAAVGGLAQAASVTSGGFSFSTQTTGVFPVVTSVGFSGPEVSMNWQSILARPQFAPSCALTGCAMDYSHTVSVSGGFSNDGLNTGSATFGGQTYTFGPGFGFDLQMAFTGPAGLSPTVTGSKAQYPTAVVSMTGSLRIFGSGQDFTIPLTGNLYTSISLERVQDGPNSSFLRSSESFTATPEPASGLLAGGAILIGVARVLRQRRVKQDQKVAG